MEYKYIISANINNIDIGHIADEVRALEAAGIDSFHVDIMDGVFVSSYAMSLNDISCLARYSTKPIEAHLMIEQPHEQIDLFLRQLRPGDTVYIHPEAEYHPSTTLQRIIDAGMVPGVAINSGTSIETVLEMLAIVDKVLVMSVNPGESRELACDVSKKIDRLIELQDEMDFEILYEGIDTPANIMKLAPHGVNGFVVEDELCGSGLDYKKVVSKLRDPEFAHEITIDYEFFVTADIQKVVE